jgi:decaprenyl-phosphate phosphoribosyltransferase
MSPAVALVRTIRPQQWVKNLFAAAALVFSRHLLDPAYVARAGAAVVAFCFVSGAVYAFNDVRDVAADRLHPTKRNRPIAAGYLGERTAMIAAAVLAGVAIAGAAAISLALAAVVTCYLVQNIAYSIKLKHVAFVDIALIAFGFLLRVLAGAVAIDVPPSTWLLACTALVATVFGLGKRAHEIAWAERSGSAATTRAALAGYRLPVVRVAMIALGVVTVGAYAAYTLDAHTVEFFGTWRLVFTVPLVAGGVARFIMLALFKPTDLPPTEALLRDPPFLVLVLASAAAAIAIIYA